MARIHGFRSLAILLTAASFAACSPARITTPTPITDSVLPAAATASVAGQVQDGTGAALAGAALTLFNATNAWSAVSDDAGNFVFNNIGDGAWTLMCQKDGYEISSQPVQVDQDVKVSWSRSRPLRTRAGGQRACRSPSSVESSVDAGQAGPGVVLPAFAMYTRARNSPRRLCD